MKITKNTLKRLIKEELGALTSEDKKARDSIERWNEKWRNDASYEKHSPWLARNPTRTAQLLDLTDEEEDYETARELERATDAGEPITPDQEAIATAARDLPRRDMSRKEQDPGVKGRARAIARKAAAVQESKQRKNLEIIKNMIRSELKKLR